jgi:excisionase family DNA binding protein
MSAYASSERALAPPITLVPRRGRAGDARQDNVSSTGVAGDSDRALRGLLDEFIDRIADAIVARMTDAATQPEPRWLDSREAAEYLGLNRDTLRKLAAERSIPSEQDGPGCKLFFERSVLDEWRRTGGRESRRQSFRAA